MPHIIFNDFSAFGSINLPILQGFIVCCVLFGTQGLVYTWATCVQKKEFSVFTCCLYARFSCTTEIIEKFVLK